MSTVTVRLNQEEETFFKGYVQLTGQSLSSLFKKALEKTIEDEYDLKLYHQAMEDYQKDPETLSHADFKKELGFQMFQIHYSKKAQKQLRKLDCSIQALIFAWIDKNLEGTSNPRQHGKGLIGDKAEAWQYRLGACRLIADSRADELVILALEIGHRKDSYN